jgi:hypothetical protein
MTSQDNIEDSYCKNHYRSAVLLNNIYIYTHVLPFVADIYVDEHDHIVNSYNIYPILLIGSLRTIYLVLFINIMLFILFYFQRL